MAINIQQGTLLLAAATLIGAFIGASVRIVWDLWNERKKRRNLRQAIWAEMMTMRPYLSGERGPEDQFLRNTIYENSAEDLGTLSTEEVEAIVTFYGSVNNIQQAVNESEGDHMEPTNAPIAIMGSGVQQAFNHATERLYPYLDVDEDLEEIKMSTEVPLA